MWKKLLAVGLLTLSLGACASLDLGGKSLLVGGTSLTATVNQPIGPNEMAAIEGAYRAALVAGVNYRRFCYSASLATLPAICLKRREVVLLFQSANRKARPAMVALRKFVRNNDQVSALSALAAARAAVSDFQQVAATHGIM